MAAAETPAVETAGRTKAAQDLRTLASPAAAVAGHARMLPLLAPAPAPIPPARRMTRIPRLARRMTCPGPVTGMPLVMRVTHARMEDRGRPGTPMTCPGPVTGMPLVRRVTHARMEDQGRPGTPMTRT